jgi:hypothetical protein
LSVWSPTKGPRRKDSTQPHSPPKSPEQPVSLKRFRKNSTKTQNQNRFALLADMSEEVAAFDTLATGVTKLRIEPPPLPSSDVPGMRL